MFKFANIELLLWLGLIPAFVVLYILFFRWQRKMRIALAGNHLFQRIAPNTSTGKPIVKTILQLLAIIAIIFGAAGPQFGSKLEEVKQQGVDIMVAVDVSNSMLAEDLTPNRLENAKRSISRLIDELHTDRIGIIVFGGDAYVQLPITTDFSAAKMFLNTVNTDVIPTQGTAIGAAIKLGIASFDEGSKGSKTILVLTDGENHEDDAIEAAKMAKDQNIVVHTIGMGSENGVPIPIYRGRQQIGFRKDKAGSTVVTQLNEEMLQEIAQAGGGVYVRSSAAGVGLKHILDEVNKMEKTEIGAKVYTDFDEKFQFLLAIGLFLLIVEGLISAKKSDWIKNLKLFEVKK